MYPIIKIGNLEISSFSLFVGLGVSILIVWFFLRTMFKYKVHFEETMIVTIFLFVGLAMGYVGGLVFDGLVKIPERGYFEMSGSAFYGGFIFGSIVFFALLLIFKKVHPSKSALDYLNIVAPCVVVAHVFGRIGCFMAGCCFGSPTDSVIGVVYPDTAPASVLYGEGVKVYPTQLLEVSSLIAIFFIIYFVTKKTPFFHYISLYAIARFIIEFYRGDDRGTISVLSPSQIVAIIMFFVGLFFLLWPHIKIFYQKHKKEA